MNSERWLKVKSLFDAALELAPAKRERFLANACGDDVELCREVEEMLNSSDKAESFTKQEAAAAEVADSIVGRVGKLTNGERVAHYEILMELGAGGMSEVYLAKDTRLNRKVALKVLPADLTSDKMRLTRFEQEAQSASALNHPNIITIHEIGADKGVNFIATEFVEGKTLRQLIGGRRLEIAKALDIAMQIASALAVAHEAGITHRDIKPENVMLREDGLVKVLDFGLAKLSDKKIAADSLFDSEARTLARLLTEPGVVMGTAAYMSPEQARGLAVDERTDVFSLGVVFYEMLTGKQPFAGETTSDVIAAILRGEPPPLAFHAPDATVELERIIKKALGKDREERYQVVKDLFLDLKIIRRELDSAEMSGAQSFPTADESAAKTQAVASLKTESYKPKRNWLWFALPAFVLLVAVSVWYLWQKPRQAETNFLGSLASSQITSWKSELGESDLSRARFSPDGKLAAYVAPKNGKNAVWLKQIGGGEPFTRKPDNSDSVDRSPLFSPDGGRIAYCSERGAQRGIWASPAFGGSPVLLASLGSRCQELIHWSKDGAIVYFEMNDNLHSLDVASKQTTQLTNFDTSQVIRRNFSISPDEKRIVYADRRDGQKDLWTADLRGENPARLTDDAAEDSHPVWHADGRRVVYSSNRNGIKQICLAFTDGRPPVQLTFSDSDSDVADISPDGAKILYETTRDESDLWGARLEDGKELQLTSDIGIEFWQDVAPDGETIAYQAARRSSLGGKLFQCLILSQKIAGGNAQLQMSADGFNPRWSPDGSHLAFLRSEAGNNSLWITSAAGGDARKLTDGGVLFGGYLLLPFNRIQTQDYGWSPDSRSLIYSANRGGVSNLWQAAADGAGETQLTNNPDKSLLFFNPLFSPDGKRIVWLTMLSGGGQKKTDWGIWVFENGTVRQIYQSDSILGLVGWSQPGNDLIVKSVEGASLAALPLPVEVSLFGLAPDGGAARPITKLKETFFQNIQLSPDRKTLAFVTRTGGSGVIQTISSTGGTAKTLISSNDARVYFSSLAFAPDGKTLYYGKQANWQIISMIENFK